MPETLVNCANCAEGARAEAVSARLLRIVLLTVLSGAMAIHAQEKGAVTVSHVGTQAKVTIAEPTPLSQVLDELCRQTNAQCLGTQQANQIVVSPRVSVGEWRKVVADLLEGADFNYVVTADSGSAAGSLEILGPASAPQPSATPANTAPLTANNPSDAPGSSAAEINGTEPHVEAGDRPDSAPADATSLSTATPSPRVSGSDEPAQAARLDLSAESAAAAENRFLPFPDDFGNPIPVSSYTPQYLPFPGSDGKPIPVSNFTAPSFLPFPGPDGKPIAISHQPVQYLPFPDSYGNPIPVRPVTQH